MSKMKWLLPIALLLGVCFSACNKDNLSGNEKTVGATMAGRVLDEFGNPLANALVKAGDKMALSDKNGVFNLGKTILLADHAIVSVEMYGIFRFSRACVVEDGSVQNLSLEVLNKYRLSFDAGTGGEVDLGLNQPKLVFSSNAVARENNDSYLGNVQVLSAYFDSTELVLRPLYAPGNFTGINLAGEKRSISSYGMFALDLISESGENLKISEGQTVEIHFPIDAGMASGAPAEVPLWYFDPEKAYWMEEGSAQKQGDEYVGKIKRLGYWSCGQSLPEIKMKGKVYAGDTDHPLSGLEIYISPADGTSGKVCGQASTDNNGAFGSIVPKDIPLKITVISRSYKCGNEVLYEEEIGSLSGDATLPPIVLGNVSTLKLTGRLVDCSGAPVSGGYARVGFDGGEAFVFPGSDGAFQLNQVLCNAAAASVSVTGFNPDQLQESASLPFTANSGDFTVKAGDVPTCAVLSEFLRYTVDGGAEILELSPEAKSDGAATTITAQYYSPGYIISEHYLGFSFYHLNQPTGEFPFLGISLSNIDVSTFGAMKTTVTQFGNVGELIAGTFDGHVTDKSGVIHTVSGSYRVIRDQ